MTTEQEIFESRFQNILQEPEGCCTSLQSADNQKGSLLTSESSENKSSSESEGSSDAVSMQLTHLEEKFKAVSEQLNGLIRGPSLKPNRKEKLKREKRLYEKYLARLKIISSKYKPIGETSLHADSHNYRVHLICKKEFSSIPLTYQEKKQLKSDIHKLPGDKLNGLLNIIRNGETCIQKTAPDEVIVDFDLLKTSTLRALQRFVALCFSKCNGDGKKKNLKAKGRLTEKIKENEKRFNSSECAPKEKLLAEAPTSPDCSCLSHLRNGSCSSSSSGSSSSSCTASSGSSDSTDSESGSEMMNKSKYFRQNIHKVVYDVRIKQMMEAKSLTNTSVRTLQSGITKKDCYLMHQNADLTCDELIFSPPDMSALLSPMVSPEIFPDLTAIFEQGAVLSPLKESPVQLKNEINCNFRCSEDVSDGQVANVTQSSTENNSADQEMPAVPKKEIFLKNAESWARLISDSINSAAVKSSKEKFQEFAKAPKEKELKNKPLENHTQTESTDNSSLSGLWTTEPAPQPVKEDPGEQEICRNAASDVPKQAEQLTSPKEARPQPQQICVLQQREVARKMEQERRRREAMTGIDIMWQSDIMTAFELDMDPPWTVNRSRWLRKAISVASTETFESCGD